MIYNYHTHTKRCGHASGEAEEYIKRAIECGIKHMGFSDHAPFIFPDGYESYFRVPIAEAKDYFTEISELREKYKEEIDIKIGFEMEYYPTHFKAMLKNAKDLGAEYLILGEHFIYEEHPNGIYITGPKESAEDLEDYVASVIAGIKSGVFTYVAHPDVINFIGDSAIYEREMRKICVASREYSVPLEINFLGMRDKRAYPREDFWRIAGEERAPVTFGFDSHDPKSAYDGESLNIAKTWVEKYNLNYIGEPKLILIQEKEV